MYTSDEWKMQVENLKLQMYFNNYAFWHAVYAYE